MPPQEQAELWMALRDRMKANWSELTLQEKKAGMALHKSLIISMGIRKA
jgi:cytochrome c oxidase subunit 4